MQVNNQQSVPNIFRDIETPVKREYRKNFGASITDDEESDKVSLAGKAGKKIKQNWLVSMLRDTFKAASSKKFLISAGLTLLTTIGLAYIGNKASDSTAKLGIEIDKKLLSSNFYQSIANGFKKVKDSVKGFLMKSKTVQDIADTFKNRHAKRKWNILGSIGEGFKTIFRLTPPDTASKAFLKEAGQYESLRKLLLDQSKAQQLFAAAKGTAGEAAAQKALETAKSAVSKLVKDSGFKNMPEMMKKTQGAVFSVFESIAGKEAAAKITSSILGVNKLENADFLNTVSDGIRKHFNCKNNEEFLNVLLQLKKGSIKDAAGKTIDVSRLINVYMSDGKISPVSNWWHVNLFNKAVSAFKGKDANICKGNFFDSLIKANAVEGKLADTALGRFIQKSVTIPTESISNHVNDKSGLGLFLCAGLMKPLFDRAQEAPKGKKTATIADDFAGTIGSIAITTPLAASAAYGLATLGNLKGETMLAKILKLPGRFFNMGLDKYAKDGSKIVHKGAVSGFAGGVMRFGLIAFVFSSIFSKPVKKCIHKIFGKPYDPAEAKKEEQLKKAQEEYLKMLLAAQAAQQRAAAKKNAPAGSTNVLSLHAPKNIPALPASQQYYMQNPQMIPYAQAAYYQQYPQAGFNIEQTYPEHQSAPGQNIPQHNNETASSSLKEDETQNEAYVPSIAVDNYHLQEAERQINEKAEKLIKRADAKIGSVSRALKSR